MRRGGNEKEGWQNSETGKENAKKKKGDSVFTGRALGSEGKKIAPAVGVGILPGRRKKRRVKSENREGGRERQDRGQTALFHHFPCDTTKEKIMVWISGGREKHPLRKEAKAGG